MLSDQQYKCIELMLTGEYTQIQIAQQLQITDQTISNWKKIEEFRKEKERLLREAFADIAPSCKKELHRLATKAESEQVRLGALKDILDRAGYKPTDKSESSVEIKLPNIIIK